MDAIFDFYDNARDTITAHLKAQGAFNLLMGLVLLLVFAVIGLGLVALVGVALASLFSASSLIGAVGVAGVLAAAFQAWFSC